MFFSSFKNKCAQSVFAESDPGPDPRPGLAFEGQLPEGFKTPRASWSVAGSFQMQKK